MRWVLIILLYLFIDFYAYQAFRTLSKSSFTAYLYIAVSLILIIAVMYDLIYVTEPIYKRPSRFILYGIVLTVMMTKIVLSLGMLAEDGYRIGVAVFKKISGTPTETFMPSRRRFVATMALGLAALPFSTMIYGMIRGRYNFKVLKYEVEFDDLPEAFDGYTLTQFSDLHVGSWDNEEEFNYAIDLVNQQESDVILFTGDLVNDVADELTRWKDTLSTLKAKDGVYSVLGNHDYGDYHKHWVDQYEKEENLNKLKRIQAEMGWKLLNNEHVWLEKDNQRIALVGVENWGNGNFKKAGDLDKASRGVKDSDFKILMSHDPTHWESHVRDNPITYHITLSGHTHGMQYGIEIPGFVRWSPSQFRYEHWAGLYRENKRYLNVNRGLGFLGYPGRFGVWPEVTVIKLKKKRQDNS